MHKISYQFKKESITVTYNKQRICFHNYYENSFKQTAAFKQFAHKLAENQPQNLITVIGMARRRNIKSQAGYDSTIDSPIIF